MTGNSEAEKKKRFLTSIVLAVAGAAVGFFLLLFVLVNDAWIVVHLPSAPWSTAPPSPILEARLFAIMGISCAVGILSGVFFFRAIGRRNIRDREIQARRIKELEDELERIHRLLATTREKG